MMTWGLFSILSVLLLCYIVLVCIKYFIDNKAEPETKKYFYAVFDHSLKLIKEAQEPKI